jgi:Prephenate dehydrogenase
MNKEAVLEMLERFTKDLSILQNAISNEDLSFLEKTFRSTRSVRKIIEDLGQAGTFDPTEKNKK